MLDTITKAVALFLSPVLALTSTLLILFAYLAPPALLQTRVALVTISPGRLVPLPGDTVDNVDGPTVRMGVLGESRYSITPLDIEHTIQDHALSRITRLKPIVPTFQSHLFMVRVSLLTSRRDETEVNLLPRLLYTSE